MARMLDVVSMGALARRRSAGKRPFRGRPTTPAVSGPPAAGLPSPHPVHPVIRSQ